ncbi:hypothetical protein Dda_6045 [Drechslerella dactyloides]|uniref:RRM domain-containing protein n=1 Tax=Drechslerella dactyloides TaxID=74499 RepID=A0AAD6NI80_DREDA|nr:hypothetical protein Dda_6045 [Drechslerella dactyloides]
MHCYATVNVAGDVRERCLRAVVSALGHSRVAGARIWGSPSDAAAHRHLTTCMSHLLPSPPITTSTTTTVITAASLSIAISPTDRNHNHLSLSDSHSSHINITMADDASADAEAALFDARGFPITLEGMHQDDRVSFSKVSSRYSLEQDDGTEFEFDDKLRRWYEVLDDSLAEEQAKAYGGGEPEQPDGNKNGAAKTAPAATPNKKRKSHSNDGDDGNTAASKRSKKNGKPDQPPAARVNKAVYVTNLPLDATAQEVEELFSRYGVIAEEIDSGKKRVKLYTDDSGQPKGDALIVYFRPESVNLAIQMLDDTDFRMGVGDAGGRLRVQAADYSYKAQQDAPADKKMTRDKKKIIAKSQKLNNKLADWDDDDPAPAGTRASKYDKVAILKHMFTLQELAEDPAAMLDIKEDIREECGKLGDVTNVTLYDEEEAGVVSVRFANEQSAQACVRMMDGRHFAGAKVEAYIYDGQERFKKSKTKESEADEKARLDQFGAWLEEEGEDDDE